MLPALIVGVALALAGLSGVLWYLLRSFPPGQAVEEVPQAPFRALLEAHGIQLAELAAKVEGLGARHEGLAREARNAAERARYHAERVAALLRDGSELDDTDEDVYAGDGGGSGAQGVLPLRESVEARPGGDERPRLDPRSIAALN